MHDLHAPILERLIRRGQRARDFDHRLPADWLAVAFLGLMHVAADKVAAGRLDDVQAGEALRRTVPRVFGVDSGSG